MLLSEVTTLRLGGPAEQVIEAVDEASLIDAVREADRAGRPVLLVGGGSNLVVADSGFAGTVVLVRTRGVEVSADACSGATVTVAAGESWDDFVRHAVDHDWAGVEALAGIPGSVGATVIQNVGAYGQEVADTIVSARTWDRREERVRTLMFDDLAFGYRHSRLKDEPDRYVVLTVTFQLRFAAGVGEPVRYAELAARLGVDVGERAPLGAVRETVLALRRGKGMVLDPQDYDTWSAGSFFTNPVLSAAEARRLPAEAPRFPQPDGRVKTSAAWLISHAGFAKGYRRGGVGLSTKHVLALTNRGNGTTTELLDLAREVRDGVDGRFGVRLVNEPVIVGARL